MNDFTITHIAGIELSLPMLFKYIDAKGKSFQFQADDGTEYASKESIEITFEENYWLCAYQTTQEFWQAVVEASSNENLNSKPSHFQGKTRPVEKVSWSNVQQFINAIKTLIEKGLITFLERPNYLIKASLPSESQWEYAAKSENETVFSGSNQLDDVAWYSGNSGKQTMPVALKEPNFMELYDMSGNVWEWCADTFEISLAISPKNGSAARLNSDYRTIRGGGYFGGSYRCRVRDRFRFRPDSSNDNIGFRLMFH